MEHKELPTEIMSRKLEEGLRRVFKAQRGIAQTEIYSQAPGYGHAARTGVLRQSLAQEPMGVEPAGSGVRAVVEYPTHIRFLDMKKHGNRKIYNRQLWGALYKQTFKEIAEEYRAMWREQFTSMLERTFRE